jgi:hypothetical protein
MKANSADAKAIKAAVESKDYDHRDKAKDIMGPQKRSRPLPKGSTTEKRKPPPSGKNPTILPKPQNLGKAANERRRLCQR